MAKGTDDSEPTALVKRRGRPADACALSVGGLAVLRALADAEEAEEARPTYADLASRCRFLHPTTARVRVLELSDRRLIDGHGTARRLTEAGWETLEGDTR